MLNLVTPFIRNPRESMHHSSVVFFKIYNIERNKKEPFSYFSHLKIIRSLHVSVNVNIITRLRDLSLSVKTSLLKQFNQSDVL